jgi:hypothetical protein
MRAPSGQRARRICSGARRSDRYLATDLDNAIGRKPELGRRQLLWFAVTRHPTAEWLAQQIVEAFPWETAPTYLVRDNDAPA